MKNLKLNVAKLCIALTVLTSCSKDDDTSTPIPQEETISFSQVTTSGAQFSLRRWHKSIAFDNKLWVIGGEGLGDIWNSTNGQTWTQVSATGGLPTDNAAGALLEFNNKLWLIGGFSSGPFSNQQIFDSPDGINWDEKYPTGTYFSERHMFGAIVFNGKMWVIGGVTDGSSVGNNEIWSSSDGLNWAQSTPVGNVFGPRLHHKLAVLNNKMYLIGGLNDGVSYSDVWSTTNGTNWVKEVNDGEYFSNRYSHEVVVKGNAMYVIGGQAEGITNEIWKSTNGSTWQQVTVPNSFGARRDFQALMFNNKLTIIGGYGGNFLNDIWMSN